MKSLISTSIAICALTLVTACNPVSDVRLFVTASLDDGSAVMRGHTHGAAYGNGVVRLGGGPSQPTCVGTYSHNSTKAGQGDFVCSDGRSGDFTFVTRGFSAHGRGQIDGAPFSISVKPTRH
ncbi:MAG: hypothetical protein ACPGRD_03300 [Planktomarina sp.]